MQEKDLGWCAQKLTLAAPLRNFKRQGGTTIKLLLVVTHFCVCETFLLALWSN